MTNYFVFDYNTI